MGLWVTPNRIALGKQRVDLWLADTGAIDDPELLKAYEQLMNEDERQRHQRFVFAKDRHTHLVTRALVRTVLSRYAPVEPDRWQFEVNAYGRPEIAEPQARYGLKFNLSHTAGLVACVVAIDRQVGVDVECIDKQRATLTIAKSVFAAPELADLRSVSKAQHLERFYAYWTLKEAYIKARGMGLAIPLDKFHFELEASQPRIVIQPSLGDDADSWQLAQRRPSPKHRLALAIRRGSDAELAIESRVAVPLRSETLCTEPLFTETLCDET